MWNSLADFLTNPFSYAVAIATWWAIRRFVGRMIDAGVDQRFATQLENHKHELQMVAEEARFDYQKQITQFDLYATKKHEVIREVYASFRKAHGYVSGLLGVKQGLSFQEFNSNDIDRFMKTRKIPEGEREQVLQSWDSEKESAIERLRRYLRLMEIQEAKYELAEARNAAYVNELYFSDRINDKITALASVLHKFAYTVELLPQFAGQVEVPKHEELDKHLDDLKTLLRTELQN